MQKKTPSLTKELAAEPNSPDQPLSETTSASTATSNWSNRTEDGRLLPQAMDPKLAAESQEIHQKAVMKAQGTPKPAANSAAAAEAPTLTEFQKEYLRNLNQPLTQTPFEKAMAALERRYPVDEAYVSPITYEEASKLFKTIMRGELARIGRTPYYTAADSVVIKGLLLWLLRDRTSPYDLYRGIFLHGDPGLGKSLIFRALKILAANVPLPDRLFNMASTKGLLGDISITKEFGSLTRYKSGCWLLDDLMDEKDGESAAYAERMDVLDWLLTEQTSSDEPIEPQQVVTDDDPLEQASYHYKEYMRLMATLWEKQK